MKLYMKQKVFSWGDKFTIADENGQTRYTVEGEIFSWGKKLHVYDSKGYEVAFIRQKLFSWLPRYFIEIGGNVVATVVKDIAFFRQSYHLEGMPWQLDGDFWAHDYILEENGLTVMRMKKAWFTWGDSYELEIIDPQNEILCLCVTLAVDCAVSQSQNSN